jgi:hypothetical protein
MQTPPLSSVVLNILDTLDTLDTLLWIPCFRFPEARSMIGLFRVDFWAFVLAGGLSAEA